MILSKNILCHYDRNRLKRSNLSVIKEVPSVVLLLRNGDENKIKNKTK